jgi:hypothetical protein
MHLSNPGEPLVRLIGEKGLRLSVRTEGGDPRQSSFQYSEWISDRP